MLLVTLSASSSIFVSTLEIYACRSSTSFSCVSSSSSCKTQNRCASSSAVSPGYTTIRSCASPPKLTSTNKRGCFYPAPIVPSDFVGECDFIEGEADYYPWGTWSKFTIPNSSYLWFLAGLGVMDLGLWLEYRSGESWEWGSKSAFA